MDSATLHDKIEQTVKSGEPKMYFDLLGTESLRCWLNVYMPGEARRDCITITASIYGDRRPRRDRAPGRQPNSNRERFDVLIPAKTYYDIKNTGDSVLAVLGNRAEAFGGPTIYLDPDLNEKMKGRKQFERI